MKLFFSTICILLLAISAGATNLGFENFAPAGSLTNINPGFVYTESGFTLTPGNSQSAVFDAAYMVSTFPGDTTSWFGFEENNIITLTGPASFNFDSLLVGPSTIASQPLIDMAIVGHLTGGGTINVNLSGLTTATLVNLNWTNLDYVVFRTTDDAGIDNLAVNQVPEPASLLLLGTGLAGLVRRRFKK